MTNPCIKAILEGQNWIIKKENPNEEKTKR
jgi:hypothetical protein